MIGICLNKREFEYDVHSLTRAFYPREDVTIFYTGEEPQESHRMRIVILYEPNKIAIELAKAGQCINRDEIALDYAICEERKERKNKVKQLLYRMLHEETGQTLPWGTLSGIRPTKIPMALLEQGLSNLQISQHMKETYFTGNEKTALAIAIVNRERELLEGIDCSNGYSLYVGIAFCPSICLYCSFSSYPLKQWENRVEEYLDTLLHELRFIEQEMKGRTLTAIYIGGGTPTTLSTKQLEVLLHHIEQHFNMEEVQEFTVEAGRPDSITKEKLKVLREHFVSRISINPQTMNQVTLDIIGRRHSVEDTISAFYMAREMGFDNINMDLIVGLPGEGTNEVAHTLKEVEKLLPDSLTVHSLALKRAARLHLQQKEYEDVSFKNSQEIMDLVMECAKRMGMAPYYLYRQKNMAGNLENVGYAAPGKEGIYNIIIMEEKQTIMAAGAGAATKLVFEQGSRIERVENVKDVTHYITRIEEMIERKRIGIATYL